jgi:predicted dehydrogenase
VSKKVKWGVLSTAKIAREHVIPAMQAGEATDVVAIASRDEHRARVLAKELGIPKAYGSYEALLADPEVEAVYNPLPNHLHAPLTIKALEAGKHVLCEKPIALNADEARRIDEAQRSTGLLVAEAFMVRHHPQWQRVREIVRSGRLGEVRAIHTIFSYFLEDPTNIRNQADIGGGGLYDVGCYAINTARYVFDGEPERVIGLFATDPGLKTDRMMSGLAEFTDSRHLAFTCATQLVRCQRVQILGTLGRIEIEIPFNAPAGAITSISIDDGSDLSGSGREVIELPPCNQYTLQGDAFSRAVAGEETLEWGTSDAVLNMRVIDAFFRSGRSMTWERP